MAHSGHIAGINQYIIDCGKSHSTYVLRVWACKGLRAGACGACSMSSRMFGGTPSWPHEITSYHVSCM